MICFANNLYEKHIALQTSKYNRHTVSGIDLYKLLVSLNDS